MGDTGLATIADSPANQANPVQSGAESGAGQGGESVRADADLRRVVRAWPSLPAPLKAGIVAMIAATGRE